jgi:hypothetical protein
VASIPSLAIAAAGLGVFCGDEDVNASVEGVRVHFLTTFRTAGQPLAI